MNILIVWRGLPNPSNPSFARAFYFVQKYSAKHSITLLCPNIRISSEQIEEYNVKINLVNVSYPREFYKKVLLSVYNRLSLTNLKQTKDFNLSHIYYPEVQEKLSKVLSENDFDAIYCDWMMSQYLRDQRRVLVEFFSPTLFVQKNLFKYGKPRDKIFAFATYFFNRFFEVARHRSFDAGLYVCKTHLELSKPFTPKKCFVIPPGVDLEYFKPKKEGEEDVSMCFSGTMNYPINVLSVLHFVKNIYPLIKREVPNARFYVVGRNPDRRILELASKDSSIIVTGTVPDVRPYFAKSAVFVNPILVDDGGIKNKVLEAMAMGKAIVSTSLGARDIGCTSGKNILIADNAKEFAELSISLLQDEEFRKKLGRNARRFVEENYSWDKMTEMLNRALEEVASG